MKKDEFDIDIYKIAVDDDFTDLWKDDSTTVTVNSADVSNSTLSGNILGPYPSYNTGVGAVGSNGPYITTPSIIGSGSFTYPSKPSTLQVTGDAEFAGKVRIGGKDLAEFMDTISKRLAILVPDPAKLEHFEALKKAYNHYKVLEALCELPTEPKE
jgi:hypothetical protein